LTQQVTRFALRAPHLDLTLLRSSQGAYAHDC
jgi:hypothetical protein